MKIFLNSFFIIFLITIFVSINTNAQDKNKKKLTLEEVKEMCGVPVDKDEMKKVLAIQDSLYKEYLKKKGLKKTTTIPNWQNYMSNVDNQYGCKNCWAHAATGMVEGQLQIIYGSKIGSNGIDLDEMDIVNNSGHTGGCNNGDFPTTALSYIQSSKVISEIGSYPNLQGVRWDINSFSILGVMGGIDGIKNALINGPVTASFYVYQSFYDFFDLYENRTSIYHQENPLGDPYIGGHAVVIVSYNEDQQYWLCKNSWGSWWADGGYFRIGYGQCGIETWQNCTVTVNQSCYAKIVPNLINSLNTAFSYGFENGEWARLDNNRITLSNSLALPYPGTLNLSSSNITVPSNITFTINSGTKVLLNGNSIVSSGGTISVSSGAYSDGAKLLSTSGSIKGIYLPQTAINNAVIGEKVELLGSTYYTNISISNKYNVDLYGNGTSSSVINGNISVNNSQYIDVNNLKASRLAINGGVNNFTNNIMLENPGVDVLSIYNCPSQTITYSSIMDSYEVGAYINNSIGSFEHCNIEGHSTGLYFYNSSSFNVDNSYMCGNYPYDMDALAPAIAHCHTNTYSNVPTSSCHGNVIIMGTSNICMVLKANAERSVAINNNPSWKEFVSIDSVLMDIRSRVNEKVKNKDFGIDDFIPEYNAVIANLNGLMQRTSDASIIKTIIFRLSQCYQLMNKTNELKSFVDKLLGIKKMEDYSPYIKRHLMPYYIDQKDYSSALAIADEIIKVASSDEDLLCEMLYEKALIYKYSLNELERADAFFNEIVNKYPENIMTRFANSELGKKNSSERNVIKPNDEIVVSHKNDLDINNYPNPFNPTTTISFTLPSDGRVTIKVYDMLGREVKTLVNDFKSTGSYSIIWDSKDNYSNEVSSGIYFYNIKFKDNSVTKKMLLVR